MVFIPLFRASRCTEEESVPIGGLVVSTVPKEKDRVILELEGCVGASVYGSDDEGNIVLVLDTDSSDEMEAQVEEIKRIPGVINVGVAYLHFEDELDKIREGIIKPEIRFGRKPRGE